MSMRTALMEMAQNQLDENKNIIKLYQDMKAQGKKDHNILDYIGSMPKYKRITRDQIAKIIGDAKRKGIFKESVELDEAKEVLSHFMNDRKKEQTISLAKQRGLKIKDMGDKIEVSGPKGKVADMIAIHKPVYVRERAVWVPESIADEQVEAFMEATLAAVTEGADTFVFEGKSYKAKSKAEAKKLDPVGQADADIDNDGDVDSSDDYLKNRRKTIKKSMKDDDEVNEIDGAASGMRAADKEPTVNLKALKKRRAAEKARKTARPSPLRGKKDMKFESTETIDEAMSGTYMTVEYDYSDDYGMLELYNNGKKVGAWSGGLSSESGKNPLAIEATKLAKKHGVNPNGLKTVDGENPKRTGKLSPNKDFGFPVQKAKRESVEEEKADEGNGLWANIHKKRKEGKPMRKPGSKGAPTKQDFKNARGEQVEEAATAQTGKDDATTDTFQKQMGGGRSPNEKTFVDLHKMEVGLDAEKINDQNKASIESALKQSPARMGDNLKNGDTSFVSPLKADVIDGITKALQQMKTNN